MLTRPKITDILEAENSCMAFTRHFSHIKNDITRPDTRLLLTTILADGINLGLTKSPESTKSSLEESRHVTSATKSIQSPSQGW